MSAPVEVVHFTDAACPWDYSAEPVRVALEERYGDQPAWRNVQVGLHESGEAMARRGYTPAGLAEGYRAFHERYGMPSCLSERPRLAGTWAGARAVKAAERQSGRLGAALLRRMRLGWFAEARLLDERDELLRLAADVDGLDVERLVGDLEGAAVAPDLEGDMAKARRPDRVAISLEKTASPPGEGGPRYTTPSYLFSRDGDTVSVPGFQPLEAYDVALQNLAPELERAPKRQASELLEASPGEALATVEVAAAIGRSSRRTVEQLEALVPAEPVQRTVAAAGELWSWCPPAFTLDCPPPPSLPARLPPPLVPWPAYRRRPTERL